MKASICLFVSATLQCVASLAVPQPDPSFIQEKRTSSPDLTIDLGYAVYKGSYNRTSDLRAWKGIRYAAPPVGALRWQAPQAPTVNRSNEISATSYAAQCPQNYPGPAGPDATSLPSRLGDEDCLFLNVFAPKNAKRLPVFVWIHGGGYGLGSAIGVDLTTMINSNDNGFVGVTIQYRLGAFGFLSSAEVYRRGVVNAGLLDQNFALQWVQRNIALFGGDPAHVTIAGESAGGGSVMLQSMAYGGSQGTELFTNAIAASPYLPMQYDYDDVYPSQAYYLFAQSLGCLTALNTSVFDCLQSKDSHTLQVANADASAGVQSGTWAFLPVTDYTFVKTRPTTQLLKRKVNGLRVLSGNNANEGTFFVEQNVNTEDALVAWIKQLFPIFSETDISRVLRYYPSTNASDPTSPNYYSTNGISGPTAVNQSDLGVGQQQRANNIYAETTFVCPAYWLAEAYAGTNGGNSLTAYRYQYSVPPATHGADVPGYFGTESPVQSLDFQYAFQKIWGNFIMNDNPSISNLDANGKSTKNSKSNPASSWPPYTIASPNMINLNETGGTPISVPVLANVNATEYVGPTLKNDFTLVDAYEWEGGRGVRCDFWRSIGAIVPE